MKKLFHYALLSAIVLVGTLGFAACSSSDDATAATDNPNFNPETNEILTQFVFNVSPGSVTRQSSAATQATSSETFRGIDNARILCFTQAGGDGKFLPAATTASKDYDMDRVAAAASISATQSRRVLEMSLPLNTNTMLFYGKAIPYTPANYNAYGHLDDTDGYVIDKDLSKTSFHLSKRLTAADKEKFKEIQKLFASILTCIINTSRGTIAVSASDTPGTGIAPYGFDIESGTTYNLAWSKYIYTTGNEKSPADPTADMTPLEIKLANAYKEMTTIRDAELRNASGSALRATIKDLMSVINSVRCATPTSKPEAVAKSLANNIFLEINKYFSTSGAPVDGGSVGVISIVDAPILASNLASDIYWPTSAGTQPTTGSFTNINAITGGELANFPEQSFNLPQGSTHIKFDKTNHAFYYVVDYNSSAVGGSAFTVDDYYYPAELLYFGNSPLRVSDKEHVISDYPISTATWNSEETTSWPTDWTNGGHVASTTRSVAMKNDINYGTALLDAKVGYTSEIISGAKLSDNNKNIQKRDYNVDEENKEIEVTDASFILRGVLIGGQMPRVGWNYLPALKTGERQGYIYDNSITNGGAINKSTGSADNYTLVFDNYNSEKDADAQDKVYVALELENNTGQDFFGRDNRIPNGSRFYLIGELDPAGKTISQWPSYQAVPPYDTTTGDEVHVPRVFIQDFMTTANFKIGKYSLQYAYLTVPDLRSSSVTLGLSVDLKWETGLTFDNIVVGGDTQATVNP